MQTERLTDSEEVTQPIVAFRNFADAPKNDNMVGGY
jgi:hypothetical protein